MIAYASRTGTRRNLDALRAAGWRLVVSPAGRLRSEGFRYMLDNGAWTCFKQGRPFDISRFEQAVELMGTEADAIVLPDIVAGGMASLDLSLSWLPRLTSIRTPLLLAVQDGMEPDSIGPLIGHELGIFLGGSTDWKLSTAFKWGQLANERSARFHFARANSRYRIRLAAAAGADSFDGSSASRYACTLPLLDFARRQPDLFAPARTNQVDHLDSGSRT